MINLSQLKWWNNMYWYVAHSECVMYNERWWQFSRYSLFYSCLYVISYFLHSNQRQQIVQSVSHSIGFFLIKIKKIIFWFCCNCLFNFTIYNINRFCCFPCEILIWVQRHSIDIRNHGRNFRLIKFWS